MYTYLQQALPRVLMHLTQVVKKTWKLVASFIIVYFQNAFFFFVKDTHETFESFTFQETLL